MPSAEYLELEIGSDLPVGGGPQEYYGKVVKSPVGEAPKSRLKFWFSAPGVLAKLRGEEVAKMSQLAMEYDPQPPFHAGSPKGAGPVLTQRLLAAMEPLNRETREIAAGIAARQGA